MAIKIYFLYQYRIENNGAQTFLKAGRNSNFTSAGGHNPHLTDPVWFGFSFFLPPLVNSITSHISYHKYEAITLQLQALANGFTIPKTHFQGRSWNMWRPCANFLLRKTAQCSLSCIGM